MAIMNLNMAHGLLIKAASAAVIGGGMALEIGLKNGLPTSKAQAIGLGVAVGAATLHALKNWAVQTLIPQFMPDWFCKMLNIPKPVV